jgi:hypothetical protein
MVLFARLMAACIGVWLLIGAVASLNKILFHAGLDRALQALSSEAPDSAERRKLMYLGINSILLGWAGIASVLSLALSLWFLAASCLMGALTCVRTGLWKALGFQVVALLVLFGLDHGNFLQSFQRAASAQQIGFAALSLIACALMIRSLIRVFQRMPTAQELADLPDMVPIEPEPLPPLPEKILMAPSWNRGVLFDAQSLAPIEECYERLALPESVRDLLDDWICQFIQVADARDPRRCALQQPADLQRLQTGGEAAYLALAEVLGADRVVFSAQAAPVPAQIQVSDLEVRADLGCWAIWFGPEDEGVGDICPDLLGLSWGLSREIEQWGAALEEPTLDLQQHDKEGEILTQKLRLELAATQRTSVRVRYIPLIN